MWQRPMYIKKCFTMLEMASEFDKRLEHVGSDVYMCKMTSVFEKRQKYVGKDVDMWEMVEI